MGCASSHDWLNKPEDMNGWSAYDVGVISSGPGSYYGDGISLHIDGDKELNSPDAAWEKIRELTRQNPQNPPVMWQLMAPGKMVVHLQAFLKLNRDNDTGKPLEMVKEWSMLNGKCPRRGSPVLYCPSLNVELDVVDWSAIPADMSGWYRHEKGASGNATHDGIDLLGFFDNPNNDLLDRRDPRISEKKILIEGDRSAPLSLNSPGAAWGKIRELKKKNPENPPVMWQMIAPGRMSVHFKMNYEVLFLDTSPMAGRGVPNVRGDQPMKRSVKQSLDSRSGDCLPVGGSPCFYFEPCTKLGGSILELLDDAKTLLSLQRCFDTNPTWLGKGRDISSAAPGEAQATFGVYTKLKVMRAWAVKHDVEEGRYKLAKQELEQQLKGLKGRTPCELKSAQWASSLGISLDSKLNEGLACHGTGPEALAAILSAGFNERYSTGAFGNGTYLADDVGKADQYCEVDAGISDCALHKALYPGGVGHPGNVCYVLVCQVLLGEPALTLDGLTKQSGGELWANPDTRRELSAVSGSDPPFAHHSMLVETGAAVKRYRELVFFHSDRILVKYLIAYQRQS